MLEDLQRRAKQSNTGAPVKVFSGSCTTTFRAPSIAYEPGPAQITHFTPAYDFRFREDLTRERNNNQSLFYELLCIVALDDSLDSGIRAFICSEAIFIQTKHDRNGVIMSGGCAEGFLRIALKVIEESGKDMEDIIDNLAQLSQLSQDQDVYLTRADYLKDTSNWQAFIDNLYHPTTNSNRGQHVNHNQAVPQVQAAPI